MTGLPAPLTNPNCNLTDFPFMPLDVARLRNSELATLETPESCWAAVMLWCASWHEVPAASLPDNEKYIASKAGYMLRGNIDPKWKKIREGALRGFIKCSDGRLYHDVVAAKARDAWLGKLKQRWKSECERVRKHNQRNEIKLEPPTFEEYLSTLSPDDVPQDIATLSRGTKPNVPQDSPPLSQGCPEQNQSIEKGIGTERGTGIEILNNKNPVAVVIARAWWPSDQTFEDLRMVHGLAAEWVSEQVPSFVAYWLDRNEPRTSFDALFIQHCQHCAKPRAI